jgi:hypothetical protein
MSLPFPPYYRYLLAVPLEPFAQRCMGGSGIRSKVGAAVGLLQPTGSRQLAPKGMRCSGSGALYCGDAWILCGPGIVGDAFRLLYK